jgi:hypothetical protein
VAYHGNNFSPHFNKNLMGNEVLFDYASNVTVQELPLGKDKNKSPVLIKVGDRHFEAHFMGRVRMSACKNMIEKGAEFDRIAVGQIKAREKVVEEKTLVPWSRTEWNFRTRLMTKH